MNTKVKVAQIEGRLAAMFAAVQAQPAPAHLVRLVEQLEAARAPAKARRLAPAD